MLFVTMWASMLVPAALNTTMVAARAEADRREGLVVAEAEQAPTPRAIQDVSLVAGGSISSSSLSLVAFPSPFSLRVDFLEHPPDSPLSGPLIPSPTMLYVSLSRVSARVYGAERG
jgi:hypothetical protein